MASKRGRGVLRKDGQPRESSTSGRKPVVDKSGWRNQNVQTHRIKFDDVAKQRYLDELRKTGRKWSAEKAAGVSRVTVDRHMKDDPAFAEEYESAVEEYATRGLNKIEREAIDGHEETRFDPKTGEVVMVRRVFETALRLKFLEKHDPGYRQKAELELSAKAGCVLIPGVASLSDWERAVSEHDRTQAKQQDPESSGE